MKYILTILFSLSTLLTFAQKNTASSNLLKKVSQTYKKDAFHIKFTFELKNKKENISKKEKGVLYAKKDKYNVKLMKNTQIFDGKKVYNISDEEKEITVNIPQSNEELLTPTKILNSYKKGYVITNVGSKTVLKKKATLIKLIPVSKSTNTKQIILAIDAKRNELLQVTETTKDGAETKITIDYFTKNTIVPISYFKFDKKYYKKKGYIVTEL